MNFAALVTRFARVTPSKLHVALPLLIMGVLYWLSSLPGMPLPDGPALYAVFYWVPPSVQNTLHVPAYAALAWAWCWALGAWLRAPVLAAIVAFAIASAYGAFDEWHQSFVPGRYASLTDVTLDVAGAALGIWLAAWIGSRAGTTTRTLICMLAVALAASLAPASQHAASADTPEAMRETAQSAVLRVGAKRELTRPSAAAQIARDGDVIEIDAGIYEGDAAVWRQHQLTIRGLGGRAHLRANRAHAEGKAIWVIKGNETTVEGVEFSGAKVPDQNGAGIRLEGAGLTVRDCYFHDNENGILAGANPASDIVVEHSEFAHNGFGDGQSHNLYIGNIRSFTLRFSYVHHALAGHNVKSRALRNHITYNRIMDEKDGRSSYAVEFPNGGLALVIGNVIQQGPATENPTIVSYGAEGLQHPVNELYFVNNTVVNDRPAGGRFLFIRVGADVARIVNNVFSGRGDVLSGPGELRNNAAVAKSIFVDPTVFDYRLKDGEVAFGRGIDPGRAHGFELRPAAEYAHKAGKRPRSNMGKLDLGAFEYRPQTRSSP